MPDYVYFLENRLSPDQQYALKQVRDAAREAGMTVFLTGGAVRDLTSGSPVRDLDFSVQGNALKLRNTLEGSGAVFWGEHEPSQTLFLRFPGGARVEVSGIRSEEHPKPGKTIYHPAGILEDLRRRDFTANAMALSLNEGSYGLLLDPLNGVADIESRLLRLVSNYGFLEDPVRLVRASRLLGRLGWEMDEKTLTRFDNAKEEGVISALTAYNRGYELQEIGHEEDGLKILKVLETAGWMANLFPAWTSAQADAAGLEQLRDLTGQLQMQGVNPDTSAAQMQLLTAKTPPKDLAALKSLFVRKGFVTEWERLESDAKEFAKVLLSKQAAKPSDVWKLFTTGNAEAILWLALTSKSAAVQAKYNNFFAVWPEARQTIPYSLLQEMRITPEIAGYQDLLRQIFLQLIDGGLETEEKMRTFLEPFSPPAPPPPVSIKRARGKKAGTRSKADLDDDEDDAPRRLPPDDGEDSDDAETKSEKEEEEVEEDLDDDGASIRIAPAPKPVSKAAKPAVAPTVAPPPAALPPIEPQPETTPAKAATKIASTAPSKPVPAKTAARAQPETPAVTRPLKKATPAVAPKKTNGRPEATSKAAKPAPAKAILKSAAKVAKPAVKKAEAAKKATSAKSSGSKGSGPKTAPLKKPIAPAKPVKKTAAAKPASKAPTHAKKAVPARKKH